MKTVSRKCPYCGAILKHFYSHRCEYCRQYIDLNLPKEKTKEFNTIDLREVEYRGYELEPFSLDYILYFQGKVSPNIKVFEYDGGNIFVSAAFDRNEYDKKVSCFIRINREELDHPGYIEHIIKCYFEYNEAKKILLQMSKDFWRYYV